MEVCRTDAEQVGLKAHIIAREQTSIAVECGILDRLGGDGGAELLELRDRSIMDVRCLRTARTFFEPCRQSVDDPTVCRKTSRPGPSGRSFEEMPIAVGPLVRRRVGPIDLKMREQFDQYAAQRRTGQLRTFEVGEAVEARNAGFELPLKTARDDVAPRRLLLGREIGPPPTDGFPKRIERPGGA